MIHCRTKTKSHIYYNEGNGYTVASYATDEELPQEVVASQKGKTGTFTACGYELPVDPGLELDIDGEWKDGKYGYQYVVSHYQIATPTTNEGIQAYLASNLIKGIGPVTAERIVKKYGKRTFQILDRTPEKLLEISGITESKLETIIDGYQQSQNVRKLMVYLSPFGVTPNQIGKIHEHFGSAAVKIVKENPFRLCEIKGFGFLTVDPIAVKSNNFQVDNPLRIKAAIRYVMEKAEENGHLYLTRDEIVEETSRLLNHDKKVEKVSERAIKDAGNVMIHEDNELVCNGGVIYAWKAFQAEMGAAVDLIKLSLQEKMEIKVDELLKKVEREENIQLSKKQKEAVLKAFLYPVTIITGGPGRGKTTIIRLIIRIQELLNKEAMILLCAPTGRASRRMSESTGYPALTIHKAVGLVGEEGEEEWNTLEKMPDDLIIADEFSMVDMYLADKLFGCIKDGARLVLVGDKDQIESVGPGNVFKELIDSDTIPVTVLDVCFRQGKNSTIARNADKINANSLDLEYDESFRFYPAKTAEDAAQIIQKMYKEILEENGDDYEIQVLTPLRKDTAAGADALNPLLRETVNPLKRGHPEIKNGGNVFREGDKIMQTRNADEVSNGDIGRVLNIYQKDGKRQMRVDYGDDRIMEYEDEEVWPLSLAYAMTVHKAQGSEYPIVLLPMLRCFNRMLKRNIFYTAVSRGAAEVRIIGSKEAIAKAIRWNPVEKRNTLFGVRLQKVQTAMYENRREKQSERKSA